MIILGELLFCWFSFADSADVRMSGSVEDAIQLREQNLIEEGSQKTTQANPSTAANTSDLEHKLILEYNEKYCRSCDFTLRIMQLVSMQSFPILHSSWKR